MERLYDLNTLPPPPPPPPYHHHHHHRRPSPPLAKRGSKPDQVGFGILLCTK